MHVNYVIERDTNKQDINKSCAGSLQQDTGKIYCTTHLHK